MHEDMHRNERHRHSYIDHFGVTGTAYIVGLLHIHAPEYIDIDMEACMKGRRISCNMQTRDRRTRHEPSPAVGPSILVPSLLTKRTIYYMFRSVVCMYCMRCCAWPLLFANPRCRRMRG